MARVVACAALSPLLAAACSWSQGNACARPTHMLMPLQAHLAQLRRDHAVVAKRLEWAQRRPATYAGDLSLTAHQRSVRGAMRVRTAPSRARLAWQACETARTLPGLLASEQQACHNHTAPMHPATPSACPAPWMQAIVLELVDTAMHHVEMRPTREQARLARARCRTLYITPSRCARRMPFAAALHGCSARRLSLADPHHTCVCTQVARELAEWRAGHQEALANISRHLGERRAPRARCPAPPHPPQPAARPRVAAACCTWPWAVRALFSSGHL